MQKSLISSWLALALGAMVCKPINAFWRMPCPSRLMDERIDPIVTPGTPSYHVHTVAGGNGMNFTMDYTLARESTCSSCPIMQDFSNYWTPKLYYHNRMNNTFSVVPQSGDGNGVNGGMTIYYLQRPGPNNDTLHGFPEGFRMVAGNPFQRNFTGTNAAEAISFMCLDYNGNSTYWNNIPNLNCPDGLRAQVFFPSCWDGNNTFSLEEPHVVYPSVGAYNDGICPASNPIHLISLFYEVLYETNVFSDVWYGTNHPFVFAQGDPTGYGFHGDFVNGWDVDTLNDAVENCNDASGDMTLCPYFDFFTYDENQQCSIPVQIHEDVVGPLTRLPGCNPVQKGPHPAKNFGIDCARTGVIGAYEEPYTDLTKSLGWRYLGCAPDSESNRTFSGAPTLYNSSLTLESCIAYCHGQGFNLAGAEYGSQCYCSNTVPADAKPVAGVVGNCFMPCGGNATESCGGPNALAVYAKCSNRKHCSNADYHHVGE